MLKLAHDTRTIHENSIHRRQTVDASQFRDEHYVTFYGGDFSNSPFVWGGGVNFTHSGERLPLGDPFDTSVLLWTRAVPIAATDSALPDQSVPVCVAFKIGETADLTKRIVDSGEAFTSYDVDWTVKPALNTSAEIFIHLGDYIYESLGNGAKIGRQTLGRELATIHDYRQRLNQYRTDQSLVADQSWKAGTADSNDTAAGCSFSSSGACFTDRKLAAVRAYHEWMPIRQVDPRDKLKIWRNFQIGKLLDLTMLDTRQYDRDLTDLYYNTDVNTISSFANRSLMGAAQEQWFYDTVSESTRRGAVWRVVGQQIVFTQLNESGACSANRARVLDYLYEHKISNTVILSGDSHANWVSDLAHPNDTKTYDPITGDGAIGVEFAGTAVTSGSAFGSGITPQAADVISRTLTAVNADLQWSEGSYRGFFTLTIDTEHLNATYYAMRNVSFANLDGFASAQFTVKSGQNKLSRPVAGGQVNAGVLKTQMVLGQ
ncbi:PhoD-like protein [Gymnopilus junonius]|uniref:PhoD-like protein n=1 Tax=Gymnopilus junonius TaxID=109634 RepID=A0A9P5NS36_GYMJU|nr:PhoD-like protein [Gymnopilus junonius]